MALLPNKKDLKKREIKAKDIKVTDDIKISYSEKNIRQMNGYQYN